MLNDTDYADTYYVYNEYNQLAVVVPPLAVNKAITETSLNDLCYQYRYDGRSRLVEKKLPGKGWEYMVYDKQDRLVATQDAELRKKSQWLYTKYDQFSRVIMTGICQAMGNSQVMGISRLEEQNYADTKGSNNESRSSSIVVNYSGMEVYYSVAQGYPQYDKVYNFLSLTYYDSYPPGAPVVPSQILGDTILQENSQSFGISTKGLSTASYVKNTEASDHGWTKNYSYYDTKGRPVGTHSINHLGGYTKTESKLDFAGVAQTVITKHKMLATDTEKVITETFTYDHQNRMLVHKHQVDGNPEEILAQNKYNELSQLENKKVGGISIGSPLQSIDYKYNIRGWMTQINDPAALNGKLFGYELKYQNPTLSQYTRFNGNISEVDWKTAGIDGALKRYTYAYDPLNRLKAGYYQEPNATVPNNNFFNEEIAYDLNGNITNLQRNTKGSDNTPHYIDNIDYTYSGNQLISVKDNTQNSSGYPYIVTPFTITYDDNGNMIRHRDKGLESIEYNFLNLPSKIIGATGKFQKFYNYQYKSDGSKISKTYIRGMETWTTDYLDGFQYGFYTGPTPSLPGSGLQFVPTSEGYFNFENNKYIYNYTDHLGNVRVSYMKGISGAELIEENNYYPFGLRHEDGNNIPGNSAYNYKYNGKELQETGMYDYGARMYMPDIGR
ncbi:RHS repeat domain-containing protein [Chryseobacterium sp. OSA05B]|uniref:RHS repeat domain-containing protein n=1 Tax=Chryseobacterium sp. OSA05B TaxID=2862650 RepID=UPI001CBD48C3|nr:hypothetical protein [Chryseobacterium sp. OSA05B]